jgi:glycosyltransferase involved in cell wall biosynthesis
MTVQASRVVETALRLEGAVYHAHDPELLPWIRAAKLRGAKGRFVYDAHEDLPEEIFTKDWLPKWSRPIVAKSASGVLARLVAGVDAVIAATPTIAKKLERSGTPTVVVRNFCLDEELSLVEPSPVDSRGDGRFVYVGGLSLDRGLRTMLDAVGGLESPARLDLAGPADERLAELLRDAPKTRWRGVLPKSAIPEVLAGATAGLCMLHRKRNYEQSLPTKIFEYLAAGLPTIASDFPAWRELLRDFNCAVFVEPGDERGLREAMNSLLFDSVLRSRMAREARRAAERFRWSTELRQLVALYGTLGADPNVHGALVDEPPRG